MEEDPDSRETRGKTSSPLVFISHDTRDAELAEAFSKMLSSVSAGVLKSFRSSDKKGSQGIEYGVEWYPTIMKKLELASDVVCLLTPNSVNRPWILYEAGVAKGKLDTPVHGVAIGIPLEQASSGPFAQFQNSDSTEDALTQLVVQLVKRIPEADPDRDVVKAQVMGFRSKAESLAIPSNSTKLNAKEPDTASVAKIFEEIKVMFQELRVRAGPRPAPRVPPPSHLSRRSSVRVLDDVMEMVVPESMQMVVIASYLKDDFAWLYDLAFETYRRINGKEAGAGEMLVNLEHLLHLVRRSPVLTEGTRWRHHDIDLVISLLLRIIGRLREKVIVRVEKATEVPVSIDEVGNQ